MKINLIPEIIFASNLTYKQVQEALKAANESPASEIYLFHAHLLHDGNGLWSLRGYPHKEVEILRVHLNNRDGNPFVIEIEE